MRRWSRAAGLAVGVPLALLSARVAVTFVDNLAASTMLALGAAAAAMIAVALLAAHVPARRAARVAPVEALRQD